MMLAKSGASTLETPEADGPCQPAHRYHYRLPPPPCRAAAMTRTKVSRLWGSGIGGEFLGAAESSRLLCLRSRLRSGRGSSCPRPRSMCPSHSASAGSMAATRLCNSAVAGLLGAGSRPRPAASSSVHLEEAAETERVDAGPRDAAAAAVAAAAAAAASKSPAVARAKCCMQYPSSATTSTGHSGTRHVCLSQNGKRRSSRKLRLLQPSRRQVCFLQNLCFLSAAVLGVGFLQPPIAQVSVRSVSTTLMTS